MTAEPGTSVLTTGMGMVTKLSAPERTLGNHSITLKYRYFKKLIPIDLATFLVLKLDFYCELYSNKLKFGYFTCNII